MQKVNPRSISLASVPRSGNTWVRYLLFHYIGEEPTSEYSQTKHHNETPFIKTHKPDMKGNIAIEREKVIHIVRHPYSLFDAMYSYFKNFGKGLHRQFSLEDQIFNKDQNFVSVFKKHTTYWNNVKIPRLLIKYEDLLENTEECLIKMLEFSYPGIDIDMDKVKEAVEKSTLEKLRNLEKSERILGGLEEWGHESREKFFRCAKTIKNSILSDKQKERVSQILKNELKALGYEE